MSATAKVKQKQIDTGKIINILVQASNNADEIIFQIEGESALVSAFSSLNFYLLYTRPSDTVPHIQLLTGATLDNSVISVPFTPTSYFTAEDGTVQIQIMASESSGLTVNEDGTIDGSTIWETFPAFLFVAASQLDASTTIIEENALTAYLAGTREQALKTEGYAAGTQNGTAVGSSSPYYQNNGAYFAQQADYSRQDAEAAQGYAEDWADKMTGKVLNVDYSSKYYAQTSREYAEGKKLDGTAVTSGETGYQSNAKYYADNAAASAAVVSAHATEIDAIADDLTKIDGVYAKLTEVEAVADDIAKVTAVADDLTKIDAVQADLSNIDAVKAKLTEIGTVSGSISNVNTVAGSITNVNTVAGDKTNIDTVAGVASNVTTVAGISGNVTTVAGISSAVSAVAAVDDEVTTVAGIASDVSAVSAAATDIASVADELTDIGTVATNISDVSAVAGDITKIGSVADDLTNIDAVADDLTNIDNAVNYALEAEGWANGTQNGTAVSSGSPYYHNNAKYWADAVPNLNSKIDKNTAEIQNLIQKAGDYVPYKYPNDPNHSAYMPNLVPPSMAKNALVESIVGKSRGWNQLAKAMNATNWEFGGSTGSFADGVASFTASGQYGCVRIFGGAKFNLFANHYYLISAEIKTTTATTSVKLALSWNVGVGESAVAVASSTSWQTVSFIVPFGATGYNDGFVQVFDARNGSWDAVQVRNAICRDITIIFPEGVPATVAECVKACPDILKNNAYDAGSLVDTVVSGVESRGFNLWDEEWESGTIWGSGAESSANAIRSADYQQIAPLTTVYGKIPSGHTLFIAYYDENKTFIDRDSITNTTFTLPASAKFFKITTEDGYGTTYNHDICVNISGSLNGTYKPYVAPSTLSLPSPQTLRSAGSGVNEVADTLDPQTGEIIRKVEKRAYASGDESDATVTTDGSTYTNAPITATEDTPIAPVNPMIATEAGGTINTIQTQTPVIDNCLDVAYLAL